jgi:hypothetical protein
MGIGAQPQGPTGLAVLDLSEWFQVSLPMRRGRGGGGAATYGGKRSQLVTIRWSLLAPPYFPRADESPGPIAARSLARKRSCPVARRADCFASWTLKTYPILSLGLFPSIPACSEGREERCSMRALSRYRNFPLAVLSSPLGPSPKRAIGCLSLNTEKNHQNTVTAARLPVFAVRRPSAS